MRASFVFVVTFCVLLEFLIIFTNTSKATVIKGRSCDTNCTSRIIIKSSNIYNESESEKDDDNDDKKTSKEQEEDFVTNSGKEMDVKVGIETEERVETESKLEITRRRHLKRAKRRRRRRRQVDDRQRVTRKVIGSQVELEQQQEDKVDDVDPDEFIEVSPDVQTHLTAQRLTNRTTTLDGILNQRRINGNILSTTTTTTTTTRKPLDGVGENEVSHYIQNTAFAQQKHSKTTTAKLSSLSANTAGATFPQKQKLSSLNNQIQQLILTTTSSPKYDYINRLYLDNNMPLDVEAHIGNTAYLVCRLRSMHQQEHLRVSWVRNMQILTSGEFRYTSDERFQPTHISGTHDWVLEIHNVNANDEGYYECQVNSEPKPASISLYLHIITTSIEILEGPQVNIGEDEQIKLTCRVEFNSQNELNVKDVESVDDIIVEAESNGGESITTTTTARPLFRANGNGKNTLSSQHYIYWYKDKVSLEYNNPRGGIRVERRENSSKLESVLYIEDATSLDSGLYMCKIVPELYDVQPAQVQVLVGSFGGSNSASTSRNLVVLVNIPIEKHVLFIYTLTFNAIAALLLIQPLVRPR